VVYDEREYITDAPQGGSIKGPNAMNDDRTSYIHHIYTKDINFFGNAHPLHLAEKYGTPLYVYNETILRTRCKEMKRLVNYENFRVNYSAKANTNLSILRIVRDEGLSVDAMSPGEISIELKAGFKPKDILYICNNVSDEELLFAVNAGVLTSVDSLPQLERYGALNRGGKVAVRINPGIGAGHHEKVVTAGKNTKFGVDPDFIEALKATVQKYDLHLAGLNQHIGSLFMSADSYIDAALFMLSFAKEFPELEFIDFGGGFGIPYRKQEGEQRLNLVDLGNRLQRVIDAWTATSGKKITIKIEPGRYIVAESGILLGRVYAVKENSGKTYVGTDIGFNVLARPVMYGAHHDIEVYGKTPRDATALRPVSVVGNICESGDMIAIDRLLPVLHEGDVLGVLDAGAYGMAMSSNYNCRLRPAEVLITTEGQDVLIRRRDDLDDLLRQFPE
jgi:diaminopimelate decarboxylase